MAEFLGKSQVSINAPQSDVAVKNLGADLMSMFGAVGKAAETYNVIGENAALLEYRDTATKVNANIEGIKRSALELAPDDVDGHAAVYTQLDDQKKNFADRLSNFSGHTAAYDKFSQGAASSIGMIDNEMTTAKASWIKSTQLNESNTVIANGESLKLSATPEAFDASAFSLEGVHLGKDKALELAQNSYFAPAFAEMMKNTDSKDAEQEMSVVDPEVGYATHEKVSEFMNAQILNEYPLAKIYVGVDQAGNKTLRVASKFTNEQEQKILGIANMYMGKKTPKKDGSYPFYVLKGNEEAIGNALSSIKPDMEPTQVSGIFADVSTKFSAYIESDEFKTHIKLGDPELNRVAKLWSDIQTAHNKQNAIYAYRNAGKTQAEGQAGLLNYEVANPTTWINNRYGLGDAAAIKPSKAKISASDIESSYKGIDIKAQALFDQGQIPQALALSNHYMTVTSNPSGLDAKFDQFKTKGITTATTAKELSAMGAIADDKYGRKQMSITEYSTIKRAITAATNTLKDPKATLTADSVASMNTELSRAAYMTFGDDKYEKDILTAVKQEPWFRDYNTPNSVVAQTVTHLVATGKMAVGDSPEAVSKLLVANMAEAPNKMLVTRLDGLENAQIQNGMTRYIKDEAKRQGINIDMSPKNMQITTNRNATQYVVQYRLPNGEWAPKGIHITPNMLRKSASEYGVQSNAKVGRPGGTPSTTQGSSIGRRR